jgi:hypothetical protein
MGEPNEIPHDWEACRALIQTQAAIISQQATLLATQERTIEELGLEMEKLRKLLSHFINGHRSEKRIVTGPNQDWLPFENNEEFQVARAEAEAQAEAVIQAYTVEREVQKKPRNESLPSHLRREEQVIAGDATQKTCSTHGERTIIGYDTTETLVHQRPELYVLVKKYPKYACPGNPACGIASPERPTSLLEGDRYERAYSSTISHGGCRAVTGRCSYRRSRLRHQRGGYDRRGQVVPPSADVPPTGPVRGKRLDAWPFDAAEHREPG